MTYAISRILVPVDFSANSDEAMRFAGALASRLGASLELLHVVEDPFMTGAWSADVYPPNLSEFLDNLLADARRRLSHLNDVVSSEGVPTTAVALKGRPADTIIDHAKDGQFDLVVTGTHGRTGIAHLFMGSVAEAVVRRASCPVLTVRQTTRPSERVASRSGTATA